jgi:class 3 adenylate cyclase
MKGIVKADSTIQEFNEYLDRSMTKVGYVFVDLCGSTQLKENKPQREWLPMVCRFLLQVTECVTKSGGKVVKYIGDEVFAVFPDEGTDLSPIRVEHFIRECEAALEKLGPQYVAKYSCDYGSSAQIDESGDVLGTPVDRCARIAKLTKPHVALASAEFVQASKGPRNWRKIGSFTLRGLHKPVEVFQLRNLGPDLVVTDPDLFSAPTTELVSRIQELSKQLELCKQDLRIVRSQPR